MSNKKAARIRKGAGLGLAAAGLLGSAVALNGTPAAQAADTAPATTTPIKHVVVIYDENISFDHYFGTYPYAANVAGDGPAFTPLPDTLKKNTITNYTSNPSLLAGFGGVVAGSAIPGANGKAGTNPNSVAPFLVDHDHQWMCSQGHAYYAEQKGMDANASGVPLMDQFVESTSSSPTCAQNAATAPDGKTEFQRTGLSMSYADGNTVTGLWNYAQNFAMSDNSWADNFGPSTVGALNVVSGQTGGAVLYNSPLNPGGVADANVAKNGDAGLFKTADGSLPTVSTSATGSYTGAIGGPTGNVNGFSFVNGKDDTAGTKVSVTGDPTPAYDECTDANIAVGMQGQNVGDLLNAKNVTWGSFLGGFSIGGDGTKSGTNCNYSSVTAKNGVNADGDKYHAAASPDYVPHHNPFQYYKSTSNPAHTAPASGAEIGKAGAANHMYDLSWFDKAVNNQDGATLPAVSYVRPIKAEDGHGGNSDPLDEQAFLTRTINEIQKSSYWKDTAIVIAYDDSDGFYDQVAPTITNGATDPAVNTNLCTKASNAASPMGGLDDRCGPSQRLPFLVISPYSKQNYIDHAHTSQASVVKFIESNWLGGESVDNTAVSGSFDKTAGPINGMFDFSAAPRLTPVVLASNGTVVSGGVKPPVTGGSHPSTGNSAALKAAKAKLARDKKALAKAKKALKHATGHQKAVARKKVAKLAKKVKADRKKVASLS
jgi:phospholipase C